MKTSRRGDKESSLGHALCATLHLILFCLRIYLEVALEKQECYQ